MRKNGEFAYISTKKSGPQKTTSPMANEAYDTYIIVLRVANLVSLLFDNNDLRLWLENNHRVIGHDRSV